MKVKWYGTGLSSTMKDRGMLYYRHNWVHVQSVEVTESAEFRFAAEVEGTVTYHVTADINETGNVSDLSCTCPYAASGNSCKHMAALLYHISYWNIPKDLYREMLTRRSAAETIRKQKEEEARRAAEEERLREEQEFFASRKLILPFSRPASAPYRYFDFSVITAPFLIYDRDYEEAQRLVQDVRVPSRIQYAYTHEDFTEDLVCVMNNFILADVAFKRDRLLRYYCHTGKCRCKGAGFYVAPGRKRALCPGILAGLIQMRDWIEENQDHGDATSYSARQMLDTFLKKVNREKSTLSGSSQTVRLEPALQQKDGQLSLTWKIGAEKMYVVKNLTDLVSKVQKQESFNLGKNNTLYFDRDHFDKRSEKYYAMIQDAVRETQELNLRQRNYWYSSATLPEIKGSLPLFGARLDAFFDASPDYGLQMIR
ncbi:MAG: SWIM zinc finger family protein, partial [Oscillospiraceae bacterium]|nr:SWIM zinc finger family protein [Oscillospiraceae bacterium]